MSVLSSLIGADYILSGSRSVSLVHFVPLGVKRLSVKILFFVNYFQS